eukprot:6205261-Pleurochrysis_carterae.AAC.2
MAGYLPPLDPGEGKLGSATAIVEIRSVNAVEAIQNDQKMINNDLTCQKFLAAFTLKGGILQYL